MALVLTAQSGRAGEPLPDLVSQADSIVVGRVLSVEQAPGLVHGDVMPRTPPIDTIVTLVPVRILKGGSDFPRAGRHGTLLPIRCRAAAGTGDSWEAAVGAPAAVWFLNAKTWVKGPEPGNPLWLPTVSTAWSAPLASIGAVQTAARALPPDEAITLSATPGIEGPVAATVTVSKPGVWTVRAGTGPGGATFAFDSWRDETTTRYTVPVGRPWDFHVRRLAAGAVYAFSVGPQEDAGSAQHFDAPDPGYTLELEPHAFAVRPDAPGTYTIAVARASDRRERIFFRRTFTVDTRSTGVKVDNLPAGVDYEFSLAPGGRATSALVHKACTLDDLPAAKDEPSIFE
jgi:hypothetical protein